MPDQTLLEAFRVAHARHTAAVADLVPLLIEVAFATVDEVLPGAEALATNGEMNEDWIFTLRIQRVLDGAGNALFDIADDHVDPQVEDAIDAAGREYLDLLLDLTGEDYFGAQHVTRPASG